ncbi:DUF2269 family protein [Roseiflexus castenholzii]|jgi:hypothetical protein|uniref:DUF2269 family protein n=1 Tax=Roseiflexus castenholzii (strain DSM 13941 / HLO8) TaxID=383372 RepID=A7NLR1_ROSCS|nr:DUF2269 family protein [Roseiflexus castenholzii]ABU58457.1 hypothetical protein Rcas_2375 [Roseiflexus castenholzii DSM 13941]
MHLPPEGAHPVIYTLLVFAHIFTTMAAVGLNASYVIWIARGTRDAASLPFALRGVKFIDDYVANPCYLVGGATGALMIVMGKAVAPFLWVAIGLYVLAMALAYGVYTPLLSQQIRTLEARGADDAEYQALARRSNQVGAAMGVLVVIILALKIFEPPLW